MDTLDVDSIVASCRWLGHRQFSELNAFHPDYRPGDPEHNRRAEAWPRIEYVRNNPQAVVKFARRYDGTHMVCIGVDERTKVNRYRAKNGRLYPRASRDEDIELVTNFLIDVDFEGDATTENLANLELLLQQMSSYIERQGFHPPALAFSGNGYHLLFALSAIRVAEVPDIKYRLAYFRNQVASEFGKTLVELGAKIDRTFDLSRVVKIYGTRKPHPGARLSKFYGGERREDIALRDYLLGLENHMPRGSIRINVSAELPQKFKKLLESDSRIRELWGGEGKAEGDTTRTGYDFQLVRECFKQGITDVQELAAILALRPAGAVQASGKGSQYIKKTILNALEKMVSFERSMP